MFKKVDKANAFSIESLDDSTYINYYPSIEQKAIRVLRAIITIPISLIDEGLVYNFFVKDKLIDSVKFSTKGNKDRLCLDITDVLQNGISNGNSYIRIKLLNRRILDCSGFECNIKYELNKAFKGNCTYHEIDLKRAGKVKINLFNKNISFEHIDVADNCNAINVSHIYNSFNKNTMEDVIHTKELDVVLPSFKCGNGWKHNFQQFLIKDRYNENLQDDNVACNYTYVDALGNHILFQERYYYEDQSRGKTYLSPAQISVMPDESLKYISNNKSFEVRSEIICDSDYILKTRAEGFSNIGVIARDIEEIENLKQQIFNVRQTLIQYCYSKDYSEKTKELLELSKTISGLKQNIQGISNFESLKSVELKVDNRADQEGYDNYKIYRDILENDIALQYQAQNEKLNFEIEQLEILIENYDYQLERLEYQVNELEKQVPTYFITNKEGTEYIGFAKYRKNSLFSASNENNEDNSLEIYRLVLIGDSYENSISINYEDKENDDFCISRIVDANNEIIEFKYNDKELISEIIDNKGKRVVYNYDDLNNLVEISYEDDTFTKIKYLSGGDIYQAIDRSGYGVQFEYEGNFVTIKDLATFSNIKDGECTPFIEGIKAKDNIVVNYYDANSTIVTDSTGGKKTYLFDRHGNATTIFTGEFDEIGNKVVNNSSISYEFKNNKQIRKIQKLQYSKNLLNIYSQEYLSNLEDNIYTTLNDGDTKIYTLGVTVDDYCYTKELGLDIINLLNLREKNYVLSCWAKADATYIKYNQYDKSEEEYDKLLEENLDDYKAIRKMELKASLFYTNGQLDNSNNLIVHKRDVVKQFDWMQTGWQYCELPIILGDIEQLVEATIYVDYTANTNSMEFYGLSLKEALVEEKEYNTNGDIACLKDSKNKIKIEYFYDNRKLTKAKLLYNNKKYNVINRYNAYGSLVKTLHFNGMVEEKTYNDKGQVIKTAKYNKADSASKYITTTYLNEKGKGIGLLNEFGKESGAFEYMDNNGIVPTIKKADDIKISYGYDPYDGVLTSISASVNGEENSNACSYTFGLLTKLSHNNFDINFEYDGYGRQTAVKIDGQDGKYLDIAYGDNSIVYTYKTGESVTTVKNERGNIICQKYIKPTTEAKMQKITKLENFYSNYSNIVKQLDKVDDITVGEVDYNYDKFGNKTSTSIKKATLFNNEIILLEDLNVKTKYDDLFNPITQNTLFKIKRVNNSSVEEIHEIQNEIYYLYDNSLDKKLIAITLPENTKQTIEYDVLNRVKDVYLGKKLSKHISYVKRGDYVSNLVSSVWYGKDGIVSKNIKYCYDNKGNITKVLENGNETIRYTYDTISRLIREDNKIFNRTFVYNYDCGGNLSSKYEFNYSLNPLELLTNGKEYTYSYSNTGWKDQLKKYEYTNGKNKSISEIFEYDTIGNPTIYRNKNLKWNLRSLVAFENINFEYNLNGIRISKGTATKTTKYFVDGTKILAQDDGNFMQFYYGVDGVTGFSYCGNNYYYRKNTQCDIIAIFDVNNVELCRYAYDAWGNQKIFVKYGESFVDIGIEQNYNSVKTSNELVIAKVNPFRYRSYYYDIETNLYYINGRYYDPQIGRFINANDIVCISPKEINGLNLYIYYKNNPVMYFDGWDKA